VTIEARRQYLAAIRQRYKNATKRGQTLILDEFCAVCGYTRKHAIRVLNRPSSEARARPGPKATYDGDVVRHLVDLWKLMNYMCSVKMKTAIAIWLPYYKQSVSLSEESERKLLAISSSTIDRLLRPFKEKCNRGLSATKAGAFLKSQIPIELIDKHVDKPGMVEADTVAHCGNSLHGNFANSLTITDLLSGWTVNRATLGKDAQSILAKIIEIRGQLPFRMHGFACDNGSEFINQSLVSYMQSPKHGPVKFVRRRPYKKNDAAHVEQKNDTHVRQLFGYHRIEEQDLIDLMNDIYQNYWNPLLNFFCPVLKLKRKVRIGGKLRKFYDQPKTPCDRLLDSGKLSDLRTQRLLADRSQLDPLQLKKGLDIKLRLFGDRLHKLQQGKVLFDPEAA